MIKKVGNVIKTKINRNINNKEEAENILKHNIKASYKIGELTKRPGKKSPAPPFTTSTLQQEASRKLGFSVGRTMGVAQRLYEAGLITYMRTDSVNLSNQAKNATQKAINKLYDEAYSKTRNYKGKSKEDLQRKKYNAKRNKKTLWRIV